MIDIKLVVCAEMFKYFSVDISYSQFKTLTPYYDNQIKQHVLPAIARALCSTPEEAKNRACFATHTLRWTEDLNLFALPMRKGFLGIVHRALGRKQTTQDRFLRSGATGGNWALHANIFKIQRQMYASISISFISISDSFGECGQVSCSWTSG